MFIYICTFLKKIEPQESFTIQIFSEKIISKCKRNRIFKYLDKHVVIVEENVLRQHVKGISNFNSKNFYKNNFITLPASLMD